MVLKEIIFKKGMCMKEIGGYLELGQNYLPMLHDGAKALNSGTACLTYLIRARKIKKIALPFFM